MHNVSSLLQEVEDAIASGTVKQRLQALKRVTDLFIAGSGRYSRDQIVVFDDVLIRLAAVIETQARAKLSRRLATVADAPPNMIRSLACDEAIAVAGPVLSGSECLEDADLIANARTQSQEHLLAISKRRKLSEAVTDVLVERADRRVARSVAKNAGARFSEAGFGKLVRRAGGDQTLGEILGMRQDIPRHHLLKLLQAASASVREKLAAVHPHAAAAVHAAVDEVAGHIGREIREASADFAKAKARTKRRYVTRQLCEADVHSAARSQQFEKTVAALALLGRLPVDLVERGLLDENPDIVLVLAKAAGCSRGTTKALLLMRVAGRGMAAHDIERILTSYERLSVTSAERVIRYYSARRKAGTEKTEIMTAAPAAA